MSNPPQYPHGQYPQGPVPQFAPQPPPKRKHTVRNVLLIVAGVFVLTVGGCTALVGSLAAKSGPSSQGPAVTTSSTGPSPSTTASAEAASTKTTASKPTSTPSSAAKTPAKTTPKASPTKKPSAEPTHAAASGPTDEEREAIGAAQDYLSTQPFSRYGLIKQLSSKYGDAFAKKDAVYAVDHIKVNYFQQAAIAAKNYLELEHFSHDGLVQQLESKYGDGYTHAQAVYGANHAHDR